MNFGWVDMEEGGGRTTNTLLSPSILSNVQSFHGSTTYSIYSFAQLSWHSTGENDFWMVDLGFPLFHPIVSFTAFFSKTCKKKIWMADQGSQLFSSHFPFKTSLKTCKDKIWMCRCGGKGRAHHKHAPNSKHLWTKKTIFSWFWSLEDILSILLRSCPGTAKVRMTFGWSHLDSCFSHPLFLYQLSFQTPARRNFGW